jgi:hypothetical protein
MKALQGFTCFTLPYKGLPDFFLFADADSISLLNSHHKTMSLMRGELLGVLLGQPSIFGVFSIHALYCRAIFVFDSTVFLTYWPHHTLLFPSLYFPVYAFFDSE